MSGMYRGFERVVYIWNMGILKGETMKYKNVGTKLSLFASDKGSKDPKNLLRYENKSKRTGKSNLTRGAFGRNSN